MMNIKVLCISGSGKTISYTENDIKLMLNDTFGRECIWKDRSWLKQFLNGLYGMYSYRGGKTEIIKFGKKYLEMRKRIKLMMLDTNSLYPQPKLSYPVGWYYGKVGNTGKSLFELLGHYGEDTNGN